MTARRPLTKRERSILNVLVEMHANFGINARFTPEAISHIAGPCAGSLAVLTMNGHLIRTQTSEGVGYRVTEVGYALFAGIEGQLPV